MESNNNTSEAGPQTPPSALVSAVRHLLRPLVKLLLTHSITYPFLSDLLKSIYVEVATEEFRLQDKPQTDSRISLLSGVHRKDVKQLRPDRNLEQTIPASASLSAKLVKVWSSDPKRLDETGRHRPLPRLMSEGGGASFEGLVNSVSKDIRSRVILDEWLRTGFARIDEEGRVCLNTEPDFKAGDLDEKAYFLGQNIHDHLCAASRSLEGDQPLPLDGSVQSNRLTAESIAELEALSRKLGMELLDAVHKRVNELEARDADNPDARQRMNLGIYFHSGDGKKRGP
ncbi:MAG: hypothetical protein KJ795_00705 [Gammaproteobacteria bacterium]|nr:hypothetical protein [Gammaproteobacteria bacterium]MBU1775937.1 hypothetical protein [Gammaproteobacteria bacterium]